MSVPANVVYGNGDEHMSNAVSPSTIDIFGNSGLHIPIADSGDGDPDALITFGNHSLAYQQQSAANDRLLSLTDIWGPNPPSWVDPGSNPPQSPPGSNPLEDLLEDFLESLGNGNGSGDPPDPPCGEEDDDASLDDIFDNMFPNAGDPDGPLFVFLRFLFEHSEQLPDQFACWLGDLFAPADDESATPSTYGSFFQSAGTDQSVQGEAMTSHEPENGKVFDLFGVDFVL